MKFLIFLTLISSFGWSAEPSGSKNKSKTPPKEEILIPDNEQDRIRNLKQSSDDEKYNQNGNPPTWTPEERRFNRNGSNDGGLF